MTTQMTTFWSWNTEESMQTKLEYIYNENVNRKGLFRTGHQMKGFT